MEIKHFMLFIINYLYFKTKVISIDKTLFNRAFKLTLKILLNHIHLPDIYLFNFSTSVIEHKPLDFEKETSVILIFLELYTACIQFGWYKQRYDKDYIDLIIPFQSVIRHSNDYSKVVCSKIYSKWIFQICYPCTSMGNANFLL